RDAHTLQDLSDDARPERVEVQLDVRQLGHAWLGPRSTQESPGEFFESRVALGARPREHPLDVWPQPGLAPVVARRLLRARGLAGARGLEQRGGGGRVEVGVAAGGKTVAAPGSALIPGIFLHEGS